MAEVPSTSRLGLSQKPRGAAAAHEWARRILVGGATGTQSTCGWPISKSQEP
jgi:hypothetical protein